MTGGAGIAIFGVLGAAIVAGGIYGAKRNSRKEQEA
ncbi:LPXTG cell wall anchor domain-containing protein [Arcanobacterium hippocoleae]|nr:LPXTG cell wall anchor domain-containing protein [Arcanobacterium hippocoleae]